MRFFWRNLWKSWLKQLAISYWNCARDFLFTCFEAACHQNFEIGTFFLDCFNITVSAVAITFSCGNIYFSNFYPFLDLPLFFSLFGACGIGHRKVWFKDENGSGPYWTWTLTQIINGNTFIKGPNQNKGCEVWTEPQTFLCSQFILIYLGPGCLH